MARHINTFSLFVIILALAATPAMALDLGGHVRDGVVTGLSLGHGWNSVELTDAQGRSRDTGNISTFTGAFKVGWARSDKLVAFIGVSGWKRSFYQNITPASATNFNFLAEAYLFPRGEGFWVKGGVGAGSLDFTVRAALPQDSINFKESGFTYTVGAGYEFRVTSGFAFGLSYDYTRIDLGDFADITDAATVNQVLAMTFHYYQ